MYTPLVHNQIPLTGYIGVIAAGYPQITLNDTVFQLAVVSAVLCHITRKHNEKLSFDSQDLCAFSQKVHLFLLKVISHK